MLQLEPLGGIFSKPLISFSKGFWMLWKCHVYAMGPELRSLVGAAVAIALWHAARIDKDFL